MTRTHLGGLEGRGVGAGVGDHALVGPPGLPQALVLRHHLVQRHEHGQERPQGRDGREQVRLQRGLRRGPAAADAEGPQQARAFAVVQGRELLHEVQGDGVAAVDKIRDFLRGDVGETRRVRRNILLNTTCRERSHTCNVGKNSPRRRSRLPGCLSARDTSTMSPS